MIKMNMKNFNIFTLISILSLLGGIFFYVYWIMRYNVWYDIGIYSITIVLILTGIFGVMLTLYEKKID